MCAYTTELILPSSDQQQSIVEATTKHKGETVKHTFYMLNKIVQKFLFYFGLKISSDRSYITESLFRGKKKIKKIELMKLLLLVHCHLTDTLTV